MSSQLRVRHVYTFLVACQITLCAVTMARNTIAISDIGSDSTDRRSTATGAAQMALGWSSDHSTSDCREEKPFSLRLFDGRSPEREDSESAVLCNDGTSAGYYHRLETREGRMTSDKWVIVLDGGLYCHDNASCARRYNEPQTKGHMSSAKWPLERAFAGNGLLSSSEATNPYLATANKIFVPYCSSDLWSGDMSVNDSSSQSSSSFVFMGARIIRAVIADLVQRQNLRDASYVVLAGNSAGGVGATLHLDYLRDKLQLKANGQRARRPVVQGLPSSAWYIPHSFCQQAGQSSSHCLPADVTRGVRLGVSTWQSKLPAACLAHHTADPWSCLFLITLRPFVQGDLIILQWMYDQFVAEDISQNAQHLSAMATTVSTTLKDVSRNTAHPALTVSIIPACVGHSGVTDSDVWMGLKVKHGNCTVAQIVQTAYLLSKTKSRRASRVGSCRFRKLYTNFCNNPNVANPTCPSLTRPDHVAIKHSSQLASLPQISGNKHCPLPPPDQQSPFVSQNSPWLDLRHP